MAAFGMAMASAGKRMQRKNPPALSLYETKSPGVKSLSTRPNSSVKTMPRKNGGTLMKSWPSTVALTSGSLPAWRPCQMPSGMENTAMSSSDSPVRHAVTGILPASISRTGME